MTTEELNFALSDAMLNHDTNAVKSAYKSYLTGRCHHPIKLKIRDSFTNDFREIEVPCGHCYHCRETKANQWVFRLYAHSEFYQYIYFVTLDYAPLYENNDRTQYIISKLGDAVYHLDDLNYNRRLAYHPTLLCKSHYQNFLKRLRQNPRLKHAQLSYFMCGEYGKKFGRPHFHLLLFSNVSISQEELQHCWRLQFIRNKNGKYVQYTSQSSGQALFHNIGYVKLDDLKANGNFNQYKTVNIHGTKYNAKNCFKYVCKYMFKDLYPDSRVLLAYKQLFPKMYEKDEQLHRYSIFLRSTLDESDFDEPLVPIRTPYKKLYPYNYEFVSPHKIPTYETFKKLYAPFTNCSRSRAIGRDFLNAHLQEYQAGNFVKPRFYSCPACVVPSYFLKKVEQSIYSLDRLQNTPSQVSSLVRGSLFDFVEILRSRDFRKSFVRLYNYVCQDFLEIKPCLNDSSAPNFVNRFTSVHYHVCCVNSECLCLSYIYNRHKRDYEFLKAQPLEKFCDEQLDKLLHLYTLYNTKIISSNYEKQQQNQTANLFDLYFFGPDVPEEQKRQNMVFLNLRDELCDEIVQDAINYKNLHTKPDNDF